MTDQQLVNYRQAIARLAVDHDQVTSCTRSNALHSSLIQAWMSLLGTKMQLPMLCNETKTDWFISAQFAYFMISG